MINLGYEENISLLNQICIHFIQKNKKNCNKPDVITVAVRNNLIDTNKDSIINKNFVKFKS